jgi:hypothetical protein
MLTPPTRAHHRRADDWRRSDGGLWLPGAADVPRDPMRRAGMVRRGMGMGFEPAGCCCETGVQCSHCTLLDSEYDITLSGFEDTTYWISQCGTNVATGCDVINGTHRVAYRSEISGVCRWDYGLPAISVDRETCSDYAFSGAIFLEITEGSSAGLINVQVRVSIGDGFTNHYFISEDVECGANCLDGLAVPADHSTGYYGVPTYPVGACFDGALSGSAVIDAVA